MDLKKFIYTSLALSALFLLGSCAKEKGCTNRNAINYNIAAQEDDGSCIYCNTTASTLADFSINLKDDIFGSPHFNQNILEFIIHQDLFTPNDEWCGNPSSAVSIKIHSLINQDMYVQYRLFKFSGPVNFFTVFDEDFVPAGGTVDKGVMQTYLSPPFASLSLDSITTDLQTQVIYY